MTPDDFTLVRSVLDGDRHAFDQLVDRHAARVFQIIRRFFNDSYTVEDIAQDVFLQAYQSLGSYGQERPFINWLTTVAVRRCYRELAGRSQRAETDLPELDRFEQESLERFFLRAGPADQHPEAALIARDITDRLLQALPVRERAALILTELEGLDTGEAARMLGITRVHLKVIKHRARKRARTILDACASGHRHHEQPQEECDETTLP